MSDQIDQLSEDIREADGDHDLGAGAIAEKLVEKGWVKIPDKFEDVPTFLKTDLNDAQAARVQVLVAHAVSAALIARKPLREGDYVEVLKNGDWEPGKVSSTSAGGMVNVDTERGPVTAYQGKSRIRLPQ